MITYEYKKIHSGWNEIEDRINELATKGWIVDKFINKEGSYIALMKRDSDTKMYFEGCS